MLSIYIDYSLCVGCGACADSFPDHFEIREDKAWAISSSGITTSIAEGIITVCIYGAIYFEDQDGKKLFNKSPSSRGRT